MFYYVLGGVLMAYFIIIIFAIVERLFEKFGKDGGDNGDLD